MGHFETEDPEVQYLKCASTLPNSITHLNNRKKSQIKATWIAPTDEKLVKNGVKFVYTVVEEKSRFWANEHSPLLEYQPNSKSSKNIFAWSLITILLMLQTQM